MPRIVQEKSFIAICVLLAIGFVFSSIYARQEGAELSATPTEANYLPAIFKPENTPTFTPTPTNTPIPTATSIPPTNTPLPPAGCGTCAYDAYNCSDFSSQASAQACHDFCFQQVGFDVHRLDADGDGEACESLP